MSLNPELLDLMPHTVTVAPWTGQDKNTVPTYGAVVSYQARITGRVRMVRTTSGQDAVSTRTIYLGSAPALSPKDKLTLPAGEVPVSPPILAIARVADEDGPHHTVVYV